MKVAKFGFSLFGINCYIVFDPESKECAIIDPGIINPAEMQAIESFVEKNQLKVTHLINTHLHIDHAIGDNLITEKYGIKVAAAADEAILGDRMKEQAQMFGLPMDVADINIEHPLKDGDIIKIGNGTLHVISVPGHSPGGLALYDKEDKFLIPGDIIFEGSIGRTDLPGGDTDLLINGIKKQIMTLPDDVAVFPGHGNSTTIGRERKHNPFLR